MGKIVENGRGVTLIPKNLHFQACKKIFTVSLLLGRLITRFRKGQESYASGNWMTDNRIVTVIFKFEKSNGVKLFCFLLQNINHSNLRFNQESFDGTQVLLRFIDQIRYFLIHTFAEKLLGLLQPNRCSYVVIVQVHPLLLPENQRMSILYSFHYKTLFHIHALYKIQAMPLIN